MVTPNHSRQKRWKEKQKDKKQVTVLLPMAVYEDLNEIKGYTGESFSKIMGKAIVNYSKPGNIEVLRRRQMMDELINYRDHLEEMVKTLTEELSAAKQKLKDEAAGRIKAEQRLKDSEERFSTIFENSRDMIFQANLADDTFDYVSSSSKRVWGYTPEEVKAFGFKKLRTFIHPKDYNQFKEHFKIYTTRNPKEKDAIVEARMKHRILGYRWMSSTHSLIFDENNKPQTVIINTRDIHRRKLAELELKKLHDELERKVNERTANLEEANIALKLMLKKEEEIKTEIEDKISSNVKELVLPYAEELKKRRLDGNQRNYIDIMISNLNDIVSPFLRTLSSRFLGLTPREIQIANLIKHGKSTKEIAEVLNLSIRTVEFHRANIRNKIGIKNKKASLRSYLLSIS